MDADEFRDYILGFIFYKYLSERLHIYVDQELLKFEGLAFASLDEGNPVHQGIWGAVQENCIDSLGYYLRRASCSRKSPSAGRNRAASSLPTFPTR
ncbi:type I restriction-modification system subunit M N-terminal domain-containing protein [Sedimentitalea sp. XS_ASV28]|uniref:type I restriction-modification system subunit M N-terminal domain-containing protein n=1 Tax=Sedimentitalea sp. XS_ASV28 TaxID=3241296 RepID=UPI0035119007